MNIINIFIKKHVIQIIRFNFQFYFLQHVEVFSRTDTRFVFTAGYSLFVCYRK